MGGFEDMATPDVYKRWVAFGLLSTHSRLHGSSSYRVPWLFDEEACEVLRLFANLKCRLMPYLYSAAIQANRTGVPLLRAMVLEFPDDPAVEDLDRQYMLGDSLLVAPIFREDGMAEYYLPTGRWTHLLSGQEVQGGCWRREQYDYFGLPLYVRENSLLAIGASDTQVEYDYLENVTIHVYALQIGASAETTISNIDQTYELKVSAHIEEGQYRFVLDGPHTGLRLLIHGDEIHEIPVDDKTKTVSVNIR